MSITTAPDGERALLADGAAVVVRRLTAADRDSVGELHEAMPLEDRYLRFFTGSRVGAEAVAGIVLAPEAVAVGVFAGDHLLGVAHYRRSPVGTDPELALTVAHTDQHRGVASLLVEHIAAVARAEGVRRFTAEVLAANHAMVDVLRNLGIPVSLRLEDEVYHVLVAVNPPGPPVERHIEALLDRTAVADLHSLRAVLAPRSVVVIGVGRRQGSVGRKVLGRIVGGAFAGAVHVVHPRAERLSGVRCRRTVADLPRDIDLAVLCLPVRALPAAAEECGRQGVRAILVVTGGVGADAVAAAGLVDAVRRYGMRLVGPGSAGLVNTDRAVRLQAVLAGRPVGAGAVGVTTQSGGVLLALLAELDRAGLGVSTALCAADGPGVFLDVNADDLLLWWADDARTEAAVLHLEQVDRPRQFARLARRLAARKPGVVVRPRPQDRDQALRDALFRQAGLLAVDEPAAVPGLLAVLCREPAPAGRRVAVLGNAGGFGRLAVAACARHGLSLATPGPRTRAVLRVLLPTAGDADDLADVTATVSPNAFGRALGLLLDDPDVDAVVAVGVRTGVGDPVDGLRPVLDARPAKPVVVVRPGEPAPVEGRAVFADVGSAVAALAAAVRRAEWLRREPAAVAAPAGVDGDRARSVVAEAMYERPDGGLLDPARTRMLTAVAGLPAPGANAPRLVLRAAADPRYGPVLTVSPIGAERVEDQHHCLLPATDADLDELLGGALSGPDRPVVREVLRRLAWLAQELPELAEARLDPVTGLQVRLTRAPTTDPWLPELPT